MAVNDNFINAEDALQRLNKAFDDHKRAISEAVNEMNSLNTQYQKLPSSVQQMISDSQKLNTAINNTSTALDNEAKAAAKAANEQIALNLVQQEEEKINKALLTSKAKLVASQNENAKSLQDVRRRQQELNRSQRDEAQFLDKSTTAYRKMELRVKQLTQEYNHLAALKARSNQLDVAQEQRLMRLTTLLQGYNGKLKEVDATIGKNQRNVGNYASGWDGLGNSINQITREMPAFAYSTQTGFLALSNNIPILIEEINKLSLANKKLAASGEEIVPVYKQIIDKLFHWQTLMSLLITLTVIYGKEIGEFFSDLINNLNASDKAMKKFSEGLSAAFGGYASEAAYIEFLSKVINDESRTRDERDKAIRIAQNKYPERLKNLRLESEYFEDNANAIKNVVKQLDYLAQKELAMRLISETAERFYDAQRRLQQGDPSFGQATRSVLDDIRKIGLIGEAGRFEPLRELMYRDLEEATEEYEAQKKILEDILDVNEEYFELQKKQNKELIKASNIYDLIKSRIDRLADSNKKMYEDEGVGHNFRLRAVERYRDLQLQAAKQEHEKDVRAARNKIDMGQETYHYLEKIYEEYEAKVAKIEEDTSRTYFEIQKDFMDKEWEGYVQLQTSKLNMSKNINKELADDESVLHSKRLEYLDKYKSASEQQLKLEWEDRKRAAEIEIQEKRVSTSILQAIDNDYYESLRQLYKQHDKDRQNIIDDEFIKRYGAAYDLVIQRIKQRIEKEKELSNLLDLTQKARETHLLAEITHRKALLKIEYDEAVRQAEKEIKEKQKSNDILIRLQENYLNNKLALEKDYANRLSKIQQSEWDEQFKKIGLFTREQELNLQEWENAFIESNLNMGKSYKEVQVELTKEKRKQLEQQIKDLLAALETEIEMVAETCEQELQMREAVAKQVAKLNEIYLGYSKDQADAVSDVVSVFRELGNQIGINGTTWGNFFRGIFDGFEDSADAAKSFGQLMIEISETIVRHQNMQIENQIRNLERQKDVQLQFAGESEAARTQIEERFDKKKTELMNQQARKEKALAIMQALISTAVAVIKALPNIPLSIAVGSVGALQASIIAATPIPQFEHGVRDFEGGNAIINEKRDEVVTTPDGQVFKPKGRNLFVNLPKGSNVYSSEKEFYRELNGILGSNNIIPTVNNNVSSGITRDEMNIIMSKTIGKLNTYNVAIDRKGLSVYAINQYTKTNILNNRVTFKGKQV